ncbi:hypothetical protein [Flammeovirga aprica]|uniref:Lipoprotein n=1 Tax=Flammeovirga aprica JL-4 TaxID=694437 RepID=A0A7X9X9N4_9BACT|nr:hypothetical protein [Flammeovirga aprica]NME68909.1 hypothetical protein [Flammeovirga aprica JL-4]
MIKIKSKPITISLITAFFLISCGKNLSKIESDNYSGYIHGDPSIKLEVPVRLGEFGRGFISEIPSVHYSLRNNESLSKRNYLIQNLGLKFHSIDADDYTSSFYLQNEIVYNGFMPISNDRVVELIGFGEMPLDRMGEEKLDFHYMLVLSNSQGEILDKDTLAIFSNYDDGNVVFREGIILSKEQYMTIDYEYNTTTKTPTEIILHRKLFSIQKDNFVFKEMLPDVTVPCSSRALLFVGQIEEDVQNYWEINSNPEKKEFL